MAERIRTLIEHLVEKGIEITTIPRFVRSVAYMVTAYPHLSLKELNHRLHLLGWFEMELDGDTLGMIMGIFEPDSDPSTPSEGLKEGPNEFSHNGQLRCE